MFFPPAAGWILQKIFLPPPIRLISRKYLETEAYFPKYINLAMRGFPTTTKNKNIVRMWCVFARWKSLGQCPKSCSQRDAFSDWNSVTEKITDLKTKHWCWRRWTGFKTNGEPRPSPTWVAFCSSTFMNTRGLVKIVVFWRQTNLIPPKTILKINTQNQPKSAQISYFPYFL